MLFFSETKVVFGHNRLETNLLPNSDLFNNKSLNYVLVCLFSETRVVFGRSGLETKSRKHSNERFVQANISSMLWIYVVLASTVQCLVFRNDSHHTIHSNGKKTLGWLLDRRTDEQHENNFSNPHITISKDIHSLKQPELSQPAYTLGLLSAHQRERHLNIVK